MPSTLFRLSLTIIEIIKHTTVKEPELIYYVYRPYIVRIYVEFIAERNILSHGYHVTTGRSKCRCVPDECTVIVRCKETFGHPV